MTGDDGVEIVVLSGPEDDGAVDHVRLSPEETARAARMATPELRARAVRRRRFLRAVLARRLAVAPETVEILAEARGKLRLAHKTGLHFNMSHSGDLTMVALGAHPLGLDIERSKTFSHFAALVRHACSPREQAVIAAAADPVAAFLDRWVLKEAVLKCHGTGLVEDLPRVDPGPVSGRVVTADGLTLVPLDPPGGLGPTGPLHALLAVAGPVGPVAWTAVSRILPPR